MALAESLRFILAGFAVVLVALSLLWLLSALMGRLFAAAAGRVTAGPPRPDGSLPGIPAAHLAAISAAVAVLTGGRGRVLTVRAPGHLSGSWASEGRSDQFSSHRVRWDWPLGRPGKPPGSKTRATDHKRNS